MRLGWKCVWVRLGKKYVSNFFLPTPGGAGATGPKHSYPFLLATAHAQFEDISEKFHINDENCLNDLKKMTELDCVR